MSPPWQPPGPWRPLVVISLLVMLLASREPLTIATIGFFGTQWKRCSWRRTGFFWDRLRWWQLAGNNCPTTPSLLPPGGTLPASQSVAILDTAAGATIYYPTDGTPLRVSWLVYSGPISLNSATTVQGDSHG